MTRTSCTECGEKATHKCRYCEYSFCHFHWGNYTYPVCKSCLMDT